MRETGRTPAPFFMSPSMLAVARPSLSTGIGEASPDGAMIDIAATPRIAGLIAFEPVDSPALCALLSRLDFRPLEGCPGGRVRRYVRDTEVHAAMAA